MNCLLHFIFNHNFLTTAFLLSLRFILLCLLLQLLLLPAPAAAACIVGRCICRTFLESEVNNAMLRGDLYDKMVKIDRSVLTAEEHAHQAVTKLRYMKVSR